MSDDEDASQPLPLASDMQITLQVGERRFITARETLVGESFFFASLLSGRWDNALEDGSYYVDADPSLFEHILRYLRRGLLPIFYDAIKGHDHALYLALLEEARYFQILRLQEWLEKQRYLKTVKVNYSVDVIEETGDFRVSHPADSSLEWYPSWGTKKVYVCPRGIGLHRDNPQACGRQCRKAQGDDDDEYDEDPVLRMVTVKKQISFDMNACVAGRFGTENGTHS